VVLGDDGFKTARVIRQDMSSLNDSGRKTGRRIRQAVFVKEYVAAGAKRFPASWLIAATATSAQAETEPRDIRVVISSATGVVNLFTAAMRGLPRQS
jgi:hypothetical protein